MLVLRSGLGFVSMFSMRPCSRVIVGIRVFFILQFVGGVPPGAIAKIRVLGVLRATCIFHEKW